MSLLANSNAIETGGYQISRSVRIRASATPYFDRTPGSTSGNNTWTFSCWVKRGSDIGSTSTQESIIGAGDGGGAPARYDVFGFYNDTIQFFTFNGSAASIYTTAVFRDPSAWYHLVCRYDDTQATASNRVRIYVNGVLQTLNSPTYPNQNYGSNFNTTYLQRIAANTIATNRGIDGYLAEVIMVSGQSLDPSSFGETDTITGSWVAKKYTGAYGTNGFYLNFSDNSAATSTTIGKDYSGNGNNWTPNNISVTAGSTYDSMLDVPSGNGYADGGNGRGNYATLNPLKTGSYSTLSNGNLTLTGNSATNSGASVGSISVTSGKWYWELVATTVVTAANGVGATTVNLTSQSLNDAEAYATNYGFKVRSSGAKEGIAGEIQTFTMPSFTSGDVIGIAVDADNGAIYVSKNNTWVNSGVPTSGLSRTGSCYNYTPSSDRPIAPLFGVYYSGSGDVANANFGQRPFSYTPPTGFKALNTINLSDPTIKKGSSYFDVVTRAGTAATANITSLSFQPDFVWFKSRGRAVDHALYDSVRGVEKRLETNNTDAEVTGDTTGLTAFNSNGYTIGALDQINGTTATNSFVDWAWKANGTGVSNTAGTITSTVSANTTAGFSIVTYTGTGANATVGHGLGVAPSMIMVKRRNSTGSWDVYHVSVGNTKALFLNQTASQNTDIGYWNNTSPTSTVFTVGIGTEVNQNTGTYVAYCFSSVNSYSSFGSFVGNGSSTDGPFVYCGFRPRWVMIKQATVSSRDWIILDTARNTYNVSDLQLMPNKSDAEATTVLSSTAYLDILSNGFKVRNTSVRNNENTATYIYAAFAENPFKYSNAR